MRIETPFPGAQLPTICVKKGVFMYLTYALTKHTRYIQTSLFDSILDGVAYKPPTQKSYTEFQTVKADKIKPTEFNKKQISNLKKFLSSFAQAAKPFLEEGVDKHYSSFRIPKATGGFRQIDAPDEPLKRLLSDAKNALQNEIFIRPHNAAFAYVPERCAKNAIEKHQFNQSKWFLHLDLKDFFSNCTEDFIHQQLQKIYPFSEIYKDFSAMKNLQVLISVALYKGRLPQGTPLSPFLTNIIMIPIDYAIYELCKQWKKQHFIYTRYADDIDISSKYDFDYKELIKELNRILALQSPLQINANKIHYGSNAGRNWHLGLMLNQQNEITIGYKRKKEIKAILMNFCTHRESWTLNDIQRVLGELNYFRSIEPDYHDHLIAQYSKKYNGNQDIVLAMRAALV